MCLKFDENEKLRKIENKLVIILVGKSTFLNTDLHYSGRSIYRTRFSVGYKINKYLILDHNKNNIDVYRRLQFQEIIVFSILFLDYGFFLF